MQLGRQYKEQTTAEEILSDIQATIAYLLTLPQEKGEAGGGEPTITRTAEIKSPIYAFFGTEDRGIPPEHTEQIETELKKHLIPHQIFRYEGAEHGFFCNHRPSYNLQAGTDAWKHVLELFQKNLQS